MWIGGDAELYRRVLLKLFSFDWRWINGSTIMYDYSICNSIYLHRDNTISTTYSKYDKEYYNNQTKYREIFLADLGIGVEQTTSLSTNVELIMF